MYDDRQLIIQIKPIKIALQRISQQIKLSLNDNEVTEETIKSFKKEYVLLSHRWRKIINDEDLFFM